MIEVICYHGWTYDASYWHGFSALLGPGVRVICPDRGYYGKQRDARWEKEGAFRVVLAHSFGVYWAPADVLEAADMLVLISTWYKMRPEPVTEEYLASYLPLKDGVASRKKEVVVAFQDFCRFQMEGRQDLSWDCVKEDLQTIDQSVFPNFKLPKDVLIIHGLKDLVVPPKHAKELQENLPGARLHLLEGACHSVPILERKVLIRLLDLDEKAFRIRLATSFSKAACTYHEKASVQKEAASVLETYLPATLPEDGAILEIGSGTGFVSERLIGLYPERHICLTDIAPGMVDFCEKRFSQHARVVLADMETLDLLPGSQALIVSALTLQWARDLVRLTENLKHALVPSGSLCLSIVNSETFPKWREAARASGLPFSAHPLPSHEEIERLLPGSIMEKREFWVEFPSPKDFFQSLKETGVALSREARASQSGAGKLISAWEQSLNGSPCRESYNITFIHWSCP